MGAFNGTARHVATWPRYRRNPGHCPPEAEGKRVLVRLANGSYPGESWPADGKGGCRWSLTGAPHDIEAWAIAG